MNTIGNNIKITFFGESHGSEIGLVIDGLPAGIKINEDLMCFNLTKRRPKAEISTDRVETDQYKIVSGFLNKKTTGGALTIIIENKNIKSDDYENLNILPRPSHSDYPANIKYNGFNDFRGGGFFSGRLTALWMIIGSISQQILHSNDIYIGSHIYSLKHELDTPFDMNSDDYKEIVELNKQFFPLINTNKKNEMYNLISNTKTNLDSIGGVVESKIINMPVGIGEPYFLSFESYVSQLLFSVPGIKGVEFGKGFNITKYYGSEVNDQYKINDDKVTTLSNNNGGILGGLTNGRPIIIRCAVKPTASIAKPQQTINLKTRENETITIKGRHDPQIVSRAVHVINAVLQFACLDSLLYKKDVLN